MLGVQLWIYGPCQHGLCTLTSCMTMAMMSVSSLVLSARREEPRSVLFLSELDLIRSGWKMTTGKGHLPMAKKVSHSMEMFGDVRVDNYYWLPDDSRSNPEVLSYLKQENHYTHSIMSGTVLLHFPSSY